MRKRIAILPVLMLLLLLTISNMSQPSSAVTVWTDDFDDGVLDGWTILEGGFIIQNGRVTATNREYNNMIHESTTAYGYWSFDAYHTNTDPHVGWLVYFVADGFYHLNRPLNGYQVSYIAWAEGFGGFRLEKIVDGRHSRIDGYRNATEFPPPQLFWMVHVDVVRHYNGYMYVWLNYTENDHETGIFFDSYESTYSTSSYLAISMEHHETAWIDNLQVNNDPNAGPDPIPDPLNTELFDPRPTVLLVTPWAVGLCLVVGGFLVWRRRHKKVDITPGKKLDD